MLVGRYTMGGGICLTLIRMGSGDIANRPMSVMRYLRSLLSYSVKSFLGVRGSRIGLSYFSFFSFSSFALSAAWDFFIISDNEGYTIIGLSLTSKRLRWVLYSEDELLLLSDESTLENLLFLTILPLESSSDSERRPFGSMSDPTVWAGDSSEDRSSRSLELS